MALSDVSVGLAELDSESEEGALRLVAQLLRLLPPLLAFLDLSQPLSTPQKQGGEEEKGRTDLG